MHCSAWVRRAALDHILRHLYVHETDTDVAVNACMPMRPRLNLCPSPVCMCVQELQTSTEGTDDTSVDVHKRIDAWMDR